jgi:hypothetical protein
MGRLEAQTERVSDGVSKSLEGQGELLKGQAEAAEKLGALKEEQERAFRAHTERLMELSGIAARHAKEVAEFQTGMKAAQERLASGSEKILEQQVRAVIFWAFIFWFLMLVIPDFVLGSEKILEQQVRAYNFSDFFFVF